MSDRVGQQLGNYRIERLLAQGGFGEVYLGEHIHLGVRAAIKVLNAQLVQNDVEQFRTEARTIARLIHPNIVRILEFGVEGTTPFLVMDYAPNGTLRQRHPKGAPVPLPTIVSYVKQMAFALQFAHDQKLIHRDVKPENMLLGRNDEVLLSDFGIALIAQSSRYQGDQDMAGTIGYMAPEQIQSHPRPASDQYALGIVVYEWLTGDRPFHGSFTEIAVKHSVAPPPPIREKVPGISPDVEHVVMTALAKEPQQRFGNVLAFATALEQASRIQAGQVQVTKAMSENLPSYPVPPIPPTVVAQEARPKDATSSVRAGLKDEGSSLPGEKRLDGNIPGNNKPDGNEKQIPPPVKPDQGVLTIRIRRPRFSILVPALIGIILYSLIAARLYPIAFDNLIFYTNPTPISPTDFNAYDLNILSALILYGLAQVIPLFLGTVVDPFVGFFTGGLGFLIGTFYTTSFRGFNYYNGSTPGDYFGFYNQYHLWGTTFYIALISFAGGFVLSLLQKRYATLRTPTPLFVYTLNLVSVLLGAFLLVGISDLIVLHQHLIWQQLLLLVTTLPGLILLPYLLMAYEAIVKRIKSSTARPSIV